MYMYMLLDRKQNKHYFIEVHTSVVMMKKKTVLISSLLLNALLQDISPELIQERKYWNEILRKVQCSLSTRILVIRIIWSL